jgi:hypothetical protein
LLSHRDVHLIGLGLRPEEWTIWWALNQRARRFARTASKRGPRTTAHLVAHCRHDAEPHGSWRSDALRALQIDERKFCKCESQDVWAQLIRDCAADSGNQRK